MIYEPVPTAGRPASSDPLSDPLGLVAAPHSRLRSIGQQLRVFAAKGYPLKPERCASIGQMLLDIAETVAAHEAERARAVETLDEIVADAQEEAALIGGRLTEAELRARGVAILRPRTRQSERVA